METWKNYVAYRENYATFEQARLLEEKEMPVFYKTGDLVYLENGECCYEYEIDEDIDALDKIILCPTLSMVQKWFRESKDLIILPRLKMFWNEVMFIIGDIIRSNRDFAILTDNKLYNTSEEALSAGIGNALTII